MSEATETVLRAHDGRQSNGAPRKYFTLTALRAVKRMQARAQYRRDLAITRDALEQARGERRQVSAIPDPVKQMIRRVPPPPAGSVAFGLLYGWRR